MQEITKTITLPTALQNLMEVHGSLPACDFSDPRCADPRWLRGVIRLRYLQVARQYKPSKDSASDLTAFYLLVNTMTFITNRSDFELKLWWRHAYTDRSLPDVSEFSTTTCATKSLVINRAAINAIYQLIQQILGQKLTKQSFGQNYFMRLLKYLAGLPLNLPPQQLQLRVVKTAEFGYWYVAEGTAPVLAQIAKLLTTLQQNTSKHINRDSVKFSVSLTRCEKGADFQPAIASYRSLSDSEREQLGLDWLARVIAQYLKLSSSIGIQVTAERVPGHYKIAIANAVWQRVEDKNLPNYFLPIRTLKVSHLLSVGELLALDSFYHDYKNQRSDNKFDAKKIYSMLMEFFPQVINAIEISEYTVADRYQLFMSAANKSWTDNFLSAIQVMYQAKIAGQVARFNLFNNFPTLRVMTPSFKPRRAIKPLEQLQEEQAPVQQMDCPPLKA